MFNYLIIHCRKFEGAETKVEYQGRELKIKLIQNTVFNLQPHLYLDYQEIYKFSELPFCMEGLKPNSNSQTNDITHKSFSKKSNLQKLDEEEFTKCLKTFLDTYLTKKKQKITNRMDLIKYYFMINDMEKAKEAIMVTERSPTINMLLCFIKHNFKKDKITENVLCRSKEQKDNHLESFNFEPHSLNQINDKPNRLENKKYPIAHSDNKDKKCNEFYTAISPIIQTKDAVSNFKQSNQVNCPIDRYNIHKDNINNNYLTLYHYINDDNKLSNSILYLLLQSCIDLKCEKCESCNNPNTSTTEDNSNTSNEDDMNFSGGFRLMADVIEKSNLLDNRAYEDQDVFFKEIQAILPSLDFNTMIIFILEVTDRLQSEDLIKLESTASTRQEISDILDKKETFKLDNIARNKTLDLFIYFEYSIGITLEKRGDFGLASLIFNKVLNHINGIELLDIGLRLTRKIIKTNILCNLRLFCSFALPHNNESDTNQIYYKEAIDYYSNCKNCFVIRYNNIREKLLQIKSNSRVSDKLIKQLDDKYNLQSYEVFYLKNFELINLNCLSYYIYKNNIFHNRTKNDIENTAAIEHSNHDELSKKDCISSTDSFLVNSIDYSSTNLSKAENAIKDADHKGNAFSYQINQHNELSIILNSKGDSDKGNLNKLTTANFKIEYKSSESIKSNLADKLCDKNEDCKISKTTVNDEAKLSKNLFYLNLSNETDILKSNKGASAHEKDYKSLFETEEQQKAEFSLNCREDNQNRMPCNVFVDKNNNKFNEIGKLSQPFAANEEQDCYTLKCINNNRFQKDTKVISEALIEDLSKNAHTSNDNDCAGDLINEYQLGDCEDKLDDILSFYGCDNSDLAREEIAGVFSQNENETIDIIECFSDRSSVPQDTVLSILNNSSQKINENSIKHPLEKTIQLYGSTLKTDKSFSKANISSSMINYDLCTNDVLENDISSDNRINTNEDELLEKRDLRPQILDNFNISEDSDTKLKQDKSGLFSCFQEIQSLGSNPAITLDSNTCKTTENSLYSSDNEEKYGYFTLFSLSFANQNFNTKDNTCPFTTNTKIFKQELIIDNKIDTNVIDRNNKRNHPIISMSHFFDDNFRDDNKLTDENKILDLNKDDTSLLVYKQIDKENEFFSKKLKEQYGIVFQSTNRYFTFDVIKEQIFCIYDNYIEVDCPKVLNPIGLALSDHGFIPLFKNTIKKDNIKTQYYFFNASSIDGFSIEYLITESEWIPVYLKFIKIKKVRELKITNISSFNTKNYHVLENSTDIDFYKNGHVIEITKFLYKSQSNLADTFRFHCLFDCKVISSLSTIFILCQRDTKKIKYSYEVSEGIFEEVQLDLSFIKYK